MYVCVWGISAVLKCKIAIYEFYLPLLANPEEFEDATDQFSFKKMLPRDERRFKTADLNGDLAADREEFTSFLHPEEFEHMKDIVVLVSSRGN